MTTVQYLHRIGRRARGGDFTKLSMSELTDLLQAANTGLMECYNRLPAYLRELTEGFALAAPRTTSFSVTNGSKTTSSDVFAPEEIGRSVVIAGDANWNQILGTNTLLYPYLGTTGIQSATIYGDAFYSSRFPFDRIIGNPMFAQANPGVWNRQQLVRATVDSWLYKQQIGRPQAWWTQFLGNSQGNEPLLVIRVAPAPDQAYAFSVRLNFWQKRLLLSDAADATTLPLPDQYLESAAIPLGIRALMDTPLWVKGDAEGDKTAKESAVNAIAFLDNQPGAVAAPDNRSFTPLGY